MRTLLLCLIAFVSAAQKIDFKDVEQTRRGQFTTYVSSEGLTFNVGDKLKIGLPGSNRFLFIQQGDGLLIPIENVPSNASGVDTEIKKITIVGSKRSGFFVVFKTNGLGLYTYTINIEQALKIGEIVK